MDLLITIQSDIQRTLLLFFLVEFIGSTLLYDPKKFYRSKFLKYLSKVMEFLEGYRRFRSTLV